MNIAFYNKIYKDIVKEYNLSEIQLITWNILFIELLIFIQEKINNDLNILYIRKNRVKSWLYSKIEWKINNKKILLVDNIILNYSNVSYIEKTLELKWKQIDFIYSPIIDSQVKTKYKMNFLFKKDFFKDNIKRSNSFNKELLWKSTLVYGSFNQNISNLYKNNFIQKVSENILFIDDLGNLVYFDELFNVIWKINIYSSDDIYFKPLIIEDFVYIITYDWDLYKIFLDTWIIEWKCSICDNCNWNLIYLKEKNEIYFYWTNSSSNNSFSIFIISLEYSINLNNKIEIKDSIHIKEYLILNEILSDIYFFENKIIFWNNLNQLIISDFANEFYIEIIWNITWWFERINDLLYFTTNHWLAYIFDLRKNIIILNKKIAKFWIISKPLFFKGLLFFTSLDKNLYILDKKLNVFWNIKTDWRILSSPKIINDEFISFWSNDSRLYLYNINKREYFYYQFSERIIGEAIFINNKLVIQDFLNNIYTIDFSEIILSNINNYVNENK